MLKVWSVRAGDVWQGTGKARHLVELPVDLEVPEAEARLIIRPQPHRFLTFQHQGEQLEVPASSCTLLTIAQEAGGSVVVDVEYPQWLPTSKG